jgi:3D-(3,5/4)-trihydroxycyclohexane-1,2-dione acylhydrolase (decyclizing)
VLAEFAAATGIPVAETSAGKGVMEPGPLSLGGLGVNGSGAANRIAARADVVLCVGTRLTDFTTASLTLFREPGVRLLGVNVCPADAHKLGAVPLVADAKLALEALRPRVRSVDADHRAAVASARERWLAVLDTARDASSGGLTRARVYAVVNAAARAGDWVVAAAGWAPGDLLKLWTVPTGGHAHLEFGFSCMGHELPAALGIRMHEGPAAEIFVVIGDGSLLMAPAELATAVQHALKATIIVLDNEGFGSIDSLARTTTGVSVGNRFTARDGAHASADYAALAEALGCRGVRAQDAASLEAALAVARAGDDTTVIHCPTVDGEVPDSGAFWDLGVPEIAHEPDVRRRITAARDRRRAARRLRLP